MRVATILVNTLLVSLLAYLIIGCLFSTVLKWIESRQKNSWLPPDPMPKMKSRPRAE